MTSVCGKRRYPSAHQAKRACRTMGNRIRAYYCELCAAYHITHGEKLTREDDRCWRHQEGGKAA